jgi:adenylate kinase family enzyme
MPLYLITGLPGSGKSTVCDELKRRGYEAYDGDHDHLAHWFDQAGNIAQYAGEERTPEFLQTHTRAIPKETIKEVAEKALKTDVFISNDPENEDELAPYFAHIFALILDEDAREQRVASRTNSTYGKLPHERARDQARRPLAERRYELPNYTKVDASAPTAEIVDSILQHVGSPS